MSQSVASQTRDKATPNVILGGPYTVQVAPLVRLENSSLGLYTVPEQ